MKLLFVCSTPPVNRARGGIAQRFGQRIRGFAGSGGASGGGRIVVSYSPSERLSQTFEHCGLEEHLVRTDRCPISLPDVLAQFLEEFQGLAIVAARRAPHAL